VARENYNNWLLLRLDFPSFENLESLDREIVIVILSTQRPLRRDDCCEGIGRGGETLQERRNENGLNCFAGVGLEGFFLGFIFNKIT